MTHWTIVDLLQLSVGQTLMVNYNPDAPKERGFWYDAVISRIVSSLCRFKWSTHFTQLHCSSFVLKYIYNLQLHLVNESLAIKVVDYIACLSTRVGRYHDFHTGLYKSNNGTYTGIQCTFDPIPSLPDNVIATVYLTKCNNCTITNFWQEKPTYSPSQVSESSVS